MVQEPFLQVVDYWAGDQSGQTEKEQAMNLL